MSKEEGLSPKEYTRRTILNGSSERIAAVLKRYWKLQGKLKTAGKSENLPF